jgi:hypothetical protein
MPSHLPRDRSVYELPEAQRGCQGCGQVRLVIGQEVSEQFDYETASLRGDGACLPDVRLPLP